MRVTENTKTIEILPFLGIDGVLELILDKVDPYPLDTPIMDMTIEQFSEILDNEEEYIMNFLKEENAFKAFGRMKQYKMEMDALNKWLKSHDIKQTQEEKAAAVGVDFPNTIERMVLTLAKFFNLKSLEEATHCKLYEYILITKDSIADAQYQRNYQKILDAKNKTNKKGKK